jgi:hypothetical protein
MSFSPLPKVFTTAEAHRAGYTADQVRGRVRRREWLRLRSGVYCPAAVLEQARPDPADVHALQVAAGMLAVEFGTVASEVSAATLHGLPLPPGEPAQVVLTTAPGRVTPRRYTGLLIRVAGLPRSARTRQRGVPATTPARTVVDLARKMRFDEAVVLADAALHHGLTAPAQLHRVLRQCWTWPGIRRAARVVDFADGRCETPIESRSRVMFAAEGLPMPESQQVIVDERGNHIARVDFLWRAQRTVGESDGRLKYGDPSVLWQEKRREDRLRDLGYEVVRWSWDDLGRDQQGTAARIRIAFTRAGRRARTA